MKRIAVGILLALATAPAAEAQICAGFPTTSRQFSFGARADFPEDIDSWGVEASYNAAGPLSVFGGLNLTSVSDLDDDAVETYSVGAAFEVPAIGAAISPGISVCPSVALQYTDFDDIGSLRRIPIGLGFGTSVGISPAAALMPYVIPQLVVSQFDSDLGDDSETDFGIRAGALVGIGQFYIGAEVGKIFQTANDAIFGIRGGLRL